MSKTETRVRLILVDDDPPFLKIVSSLLQDSGMDVVEISSGQGLLEYINEGKTADLVLLDIMMPKMDGFETLEALRRLEKEKDLPELPVIMLTGDEDKSAEARGFSMGIRDFVRKPFEIDILIPRIENVLSSVKQIKKLSAQTRTDALTGLINKESVTLMLEEVCETEAGILLMVDLDSFKLVNDIYGHDYGDKVLKSFAGILKSEFRSDDIIGRVGGDEFLVFLKGADKESLISKSVRRLNEKLLKEACKLLGQDMNIPLGVSVGAAFSEENTGFDSLFKMADKALLNVKQNGKHGYRIFHNIKKSEEIAIQEENNLQILKQILNERNAGNNALWLGQEDFANIYRYMLRYFTRYHISAYRVLFSIIPKADANLKEDDYVPIMELFGDIVKNTLRNSDIMMQCDKSHYLLLLPMVMEADIKRVISRIITTWEEKGNSLVEIKAESEPATEESAYYCQEKEFVPWILVADDSIDDLKATGAALSEAGIRVTAVNSGQALLDRIDQGERPDIIILDVYMSKLDGFETLTKLRAKERRGEEIPVIFISDIDDPESERQGLEMGAFDYIRKPVTPEVLLLRVKLALNHIRLNKRLLADWETE